MAPLALEEPYVLRTHRRAYLVYGAGTGRFVPLAGRFRRDD